MSGGMEPQVDTSDIANDIANGEPDLGVPGTPSEGSHGAWPMREWLHDTVLLRRIATWITVVGTTLFALIQVHIEKVFLNNTPTGGDMGAHVWAPAFLRDNLLPQRAEVDIVLEEYVDRSINWSEVRS